MKKEYRDESEDGLQFGIPEQKLKELKSNFPERFFEEQGIVLREGRVQMRRWRHGPRDYERIQSFVNYESLDSILRYLEKHYPDQQKKEKGKLEAIILQVEFLRQELNYWVHLSEGERNTIGEELVSTAQELPPPSRAKDELKKEARAKILYASNFKDSLGRWNPCAMRSVLSSACNKLEQRIENLEKIRFNNELKKYLLQGIREEFGKKFENIRKRARVMKRALRNGTWSDSRIERNRGKMGYEINHLRKIAVPPYQGFIERFDRLNSQRLKRTQGEEKIEVLEEIIELAQQVIEHIREEEQQE